MTSPCTCQDCGCKAGWQDIASAPKDGTRLLVFVGGLVHIARWDADEYSGNPAPFWNYRSVVGRQRMKATQPAHWQPLPSPPSA